MKPLCAKPYILDFKDKRVANIIATSEVIVAVRGHT